MRGRSRGPGESRFRVLGRLVRRLLGEQPRPEREVRLAAAHDAVDDTRDDVVDVHRLRARGVQRLAREAARGARDDRAELGLLHHGVHVDALHDLVDVDAVDDRPDVDPVDDGVDVDVAHQVVDVDAPDERVDLDAAHEPVDVDLADHAVDRDPRDEVSMSIRETSRSIAIRDTRASMSIRETSLSISMSLTTRSISIRDTSVSMSIRETSVSISISLTSRSIAIRDTSASMSIRDDQRVDVDPGDERVDVDLADDPVDRDPPDDRVDVDLADDGVDVDLPDHRVDVERPDDAGRDGLDQPLPLAGGQRGGLTADAAAVLGQRPQRAEGGAGDGAGTWKPRADACDLHPQAGARHGDAQARPRGARGGPENGVTGGDHRVARTLRPSGVLRDDLPVHLMRVLPVGVHSRRNLPLRASARPRRRAGAWLAAPGWG